MVKKEIIEDVLKALRRKGDPVSMEQCRVIENRWTDIEVFNHYLAGKSDGERNMVTYWACRDAAQFVHGQLDVSALIPEMEVTPSQDEEPDNEPGMVTLSRKDFNELLRRIEKLERWTGLKRRTETARLKPLPQGADRADYVNQNEACRLLGISKRSMRGYADRGEVKAWQDRKFVVYLRKDILKLKAQKQQDVCNEVTT
ncbi:helix-turn-helix domain-containing protein [Bacteroides sp. AN502]|nr:helix-turn-helix domain-containing protein [Caecibacteroides pullorum]MDC6281169.1 helix-turn-helix domain-containing protein [Caecibacteroides pullorum]